jgi:hypothetical protein
MPARSGLDRVLLRHLPDWLADTRPLCPFPEPNSQPWGDYDFVSFCAKKRFDGRRTK